MRYEEVELSGHVLDSLTLSKVLDHIIASGAWYEIGELRIGSTKHEPSYARLWVGSRNAKGLEELLQGLSLFGVRRVPVSEVTLRAARRDGVAPDDFIATTNLPTEIFLRGKWVQVAGEEMDCCIVVSPSRRSAKAVPLSDLKRGQLVACGRDGVRVVPPASKPAGHNEPFAFMASAVSAERPHRSVVKDLASCMRRVRKTRGKILFVAGPAVVHSGGAAACEALVRAGWVRVFFSGNALAVHDIEYALFGTSLGVRLEDGSYVPHGHENHLRAVNLIRREGSIANAVRRRVLRSGIMHALVAKRVPFVLAGSVRDDGPLPEVITDTVRAQRVMRRHLKGVQIAVMVATALHAVATGNLLSSRVHTVIVDLSPERLSELVDRGTAHAHGVVMDAASFLYALAGELGVSVKGG